MSLRRVIFWLSACLLLCSVVTVDVYGGDELKVRTVKVDCFKGKSINKALKKHKNDELIIEIDGICDEDVLVRRDNVTLIGLNLDLTDQVNPIPTDGIRAVSTDPNEPPNFGVALWIRDAANVTVENLRIFGGARTGLRITNSRPLILVENCILELNTLRGLSVVDARVTVRDTTLTGNGVGGAFVSGAVAIFENCIFDEAGIAVSATNHASVRLLDSTVESGAYRASTKSIIRLDDTNQIVNPSENRFTLGSQLSAGPPSNIQGPSTFTSFSSGFLGSAGKEEVATHTGEIQCRPVSDVWCATPEDQVIDPDAASNCASCRLP